MKSLLVIVIAVSTVIFVTPAFAATSSEVLAKPSLMPGSPFYFVENIREQLTLFFTLDPAKKIEKMANFAQRRLAEADTLIKSGQVESGKQQLSKYLNEYQKAIADSGKLPKTSEIQTTLENLINNTSSELTAISSSYNTLPEADRKNLNEAFAVVTKTQSNLVGSAPIDLKAGLVNKLEAARKTLLQSPFGKSDLKAIIPSKVID
ncbi:MAG: DUF5667 domain-containing protein [candidate division WWE3 bacterium]|nr:DUF5667 domain-containing protein [candidate division WWE3 bacterium]